MKKVTPRIASGFPEYFPADQLEFNRLLAIIRDTYESYGFTPLDTPDLELSEVLLAKGGGETEQEVYRFERGKNDFTLRYDLTVPLARYVAQHANELTFPFRRYQIGKVHRAERAQAGRFREFYQCDIDVIGSNSPLTDAEFPAIINQIFDQFNFGEFVIRVNDRRLLNGWFEHLNITDQKVVVMRLIDKVEKISHEEFTAGLAEVGLNDGQIQQLSEFIHKSGNNADILDYLNQLNVENTDFQTGLKNLTTLLETATQLGVPENRLKLDLKIARGLDYYTGTVYETNLVDHPELGSVCSGGRYDNLTEYYTDRALSGVGISIGLSRLFYELKQIGVIKSTRQSPVDICVLPMRTAETPFGIEVSAKLRAAGLGNYLYSEDVKFKKKLEFANKMGFTFVLIIGDLEMKSRSLTIKNMRTGEQAIEFVVNDSSIAQIAKDFKKSLNAH